MTAPQHTSPVLEIEGLTLTCNGAAGSPPTLRDLGLRIMPGESVGVWDEDGAAPTALTRCLMQGSAGGAATLSGAIRFKGRDLTLPPGAGAPPLAAGDIALIGPDPAAALTPHRTIGRQLAERLAAWHGLDRAEARDRAKVALTAVGLEASDDILNRYPHALAAGHRLRVALALALIPSPSLMILNDPTAHVDVTEAAAIHDLLADLRRTEGIAMLVLSRTLAPLWQSCDRLLVLHAAEVVENGPVAAVLSTPQHPHTAALLHALPTGRSDKTTRPLRPIPGAPPRPDKRPEGCAFGPRCAHFLAGLCDQGPVPTPTVSGEENRQVRCLRLGEIDVNALPTATQARPPREPGETLLSVEALRKTPAAATRAWADGAAVQGQSALSGVSFDLCGGETLAVVGESGSGKSTLARVLAGLDRAGSGSVRLEVDSDKEKTPRKRRAPMAGAVQLLVSDAAMPLNPAVPLGRQIARAIRIAARNAPGSAQDARLHDLIARVALPREAIDRLPADLSAEQRQRAAIARALSSAPRVVIADEPLDTLGTMARAAITELLLDLQRSEGFALLFLTRDVPVARYVADRVLVLHLGRIVEKGARDQVFAPPWHPYTEALIGATAALGRPGPGRPLARAATPMTKMAPAAGCPFQGRCRWQAEVPGALCEKETPPLKTLHRGHQITCHLSDIQLARMKAGLKPGMA